MDSTGFVESLKHKYNYSDKLVNALNEIIPQLICFYGVKYKDHIEKAISSVEIIECDPSHSISTVLSDLSFLNSSNVSIVDQKIKNQGSVYIAYPEVVYDEFLQSYIIKNVKRYIVLAHFHNLDSPKGKATLVRELAKLIRSFHNEFIVDGDNLITRTGLKKTYRKLTNKVDILVSLLRVENSGLEEGINSYEEEKITSLVIDDNYETFDYDLPKKVAYILYEKLNLKDLVLSSSIMASGDLEREYDLNSDLFGYLSELVDDALKLEDLNHDVNITKDGKDRVKEELEVIEHAIGDNMIAYLTLSRSDPVKNLDA